MTLILMRFLEFQDWNRDSTPLKARGKEAKFVDKPLEKFSGTEKDNIYVQLEVEGNPTPKFEFYKVRKPTSLLAKMLSNLVEK